jgi:hypothetical protein
LCCFRFLAASSISSGPIYFSPAVLHAKRVEDSCCNRATPCPAPVRLYFIDLSSARVDLRCHLGLNLSAAGVSSFPPLCLRTSASPRLFFFHKAVWAARFQETAPSVLVAAQIDRTCSVFSSCGFPCLVQSARPGAFALQLLRDYGLQFCSS